MVYSHKGFCLSTETVLYTLTGTFDVQNVTIVPKRDGQYEITCVFASGSQSKGCRIVILPEGGGGDCELSITARRPERGGESVVNVDLPAAGEYSLVVYDDELVTQGNPAFTTSLSIPGPTPKAGIAICALIIVYCQFIVLANYRVCV